MARRPRSRTPGTPEYKRRQARIAARKARRQGTTPAKPPTAPVGPHLTPDERGQEIELEFDYENSIAQALADLQDVTDPNVVAAAQARIDDAYKRGVGDTTEQLAGRGLVGQGVNDAHLTDVRRVKQLSELDLQNQISRANARYNALKTALDTRITQHRLNFATMRGSKIQVGQPGSPASGGGGGAGTAPGGSKPTTKGSAATGPPPGPGYVWTGFQWVKAGAKSPGIAGHAGNKRGLPSGPPPGPGYYWTGTRWAKVPRR